MSVVFTSVRGRWGRDMFSGTAHSAYRQSSNTVTRPLAQPTRSATFLRRPSLAVHRALLCVRGPPLHEAGNLRNCGTGTLRRHRHAATRSACAAGGDAAGHHGGLQHCGPAAQGGLLVRSQALPERLHLRPWIAWPPVCKGHGARCHSCGACHPYTIYTAADLCTRSPAAIHLIQVHCGDLHF